MLEDEAHELAALLRDAADAAVRTVLGDSAVREASAVIVTPDAAGHAAGDSADDLPTG